jgi:hypothetical protein
MTDAGHLSELLLFIKKVERKMCVHGHQVNSDSLKYSDAYILL